MNENICILFQILLQFVPKGPIENKPALVQVMACYAKQATSHYLNQCLPSSFIYIYIYAALGRDELILSKQNKA